MAFSYVSYTGNGSTKTFAITFNYLPETVVVSADPKGIEVHIDNIKQTSGYTVDTSLNQVTFTTAPSASAEVKILRVTPRGKADRLVDFADGTVLNESQLDTSALQLLYISQEAFEQSSAGGGGTPNYLPYESNNGWWDAVFGGTVRSIENVKTGLADTSVANKKYVGTGGTSGVPQSFTFLNLTGTTNSFALTGAPQVNEKMLVVTISGVLQVPGSDFSVIGGAVDSTLVFTTAPGTAASPVDLSVQNFGLMRFLSGIELTAGQVTPEALDQTDGSEAVTTATIRDDAVTADQIADSAVDLARLDTAAFTTSSGASTPRFLSVPQNLTTLGLDTLKTEHIEDFTTDIRAQNSVDSFGPAAAAWSNGGFEITNVASPSAGTSAATRTWVEDEITAALSDSGVVKLAQTIVNAGTNSLVYLDGWQNSAYKSYFVDVVGVVADSSSALAVEFKVDGSWHYTDGDYACNWSITGEHSSTGPHANAWAGGVCAYTAPSEAHGYVTPVLDASNWSSTNKEEKGVANFRIELPNNDSGYGGRKSVISKGYVSEAGAFSTGGSTGGLPGALSAGHADWTIKTIARSGIGTGVITGLRFAFMNDFDNNTIDASMAAGAKFVIYGRKY